MKLPPIAIPNGTPRLSMPNVSDSNRKKEDSEANEATLAENSEEVPKRSDSQDSGNGSTLFDPVDPNVKFNPTYL